MVTPGFRKRKSTEDSRKPGATVPAKEKNSSVDEKLPLRTRYNPKLTDKQSIISHKLLAKLVIGAGAVIYLIVSKMREGDSYVSMARVDETVTSKRFQQFLCSPAYKREIQALDQSCLPSQCGRFMLDDVITLDESHKLLNMAKKGLSKGIPTGGISTLDLDTGDMPHSENAIKLFESHPDVFTVQEFQLFNAVKNRVKEHIAEHYNVDYDKLYLTSPTFFSELTAVPPMTREDQYWQSQIDKDVNPMYHYSSHLFLTNYKRDFTGGRFVFVDNHMKINRTIDPKEGRLVVFTSGHENRYRVEEVSGGTRYALSLGFSCDPSNQIAQPGSTLHL